MAVSLSGCCMHLAGEQEVLVVCGCRYWQFHYSGCDLPGQIEDQNDSVMILFSFCFGL